MRREPSEAELAALGLRPSDVADDFVVELWPDTEPAISLFIALRTQWRMGFSGPVGLDYCAAESVMRVRRLPAASRCELLEDLRHMEDEALRVFAEESK